MTTNQAIDGAKPVTYLTQNKKHPQWYEMADLTDNYSGSQRWSEPFPVYRGPHNSAPVAEYKLRMGDAMEVFDALKVERLSRKVEHEDLGPMGATAIEIWSTAIGITLEMQTSMGGCTLIVRTAPVALVMPDQKAVSALVTMAARQADLINGANYYTAAELAAKAVIDEVTRLNTKS